MSHSDQFLTFGEPAMRAALEMSADEFTMARCCGKVPLPSTRSGDEARWSVEDLAKAARKNAPRGLKGLDQILHAMKALQRAETAERGGV